MTEKNEMGVKQLSEQDIEQVAGGTGNGETDAVDGPGGADFDWDTGGADNGWADEDVLGGANAGWGTDPVAMPKVP